MKACAPKALASPYQQDVCSSLEVCLFGVEMLAIAYYRGVEQIHDRHQPGIPKDFDLQGLLHGHRVSADWLRSAIRIADVFFIRR